MADPIEETKIFKNPLKLPAKLNNTFDPKWLD